jgi:hypothetical protein
MRKSNAAYGYADKVANPVNDAHGMRDALVRLGFDVILGEDSDQRALRRAIGEFADRVEGADVATVVFCRPTARPSATHRMWCPRSFRAWANAPKCRAYPDTATVTRNAQLKER